MVRCCLRPRCAQLSIPQRLPRHLAPMVLASAVLALAWAEAQGCFTLSGFVWREMGLGAGGLAVMVQLSRQPQARQGRLKTGMSRRC